MNSTKSPQKIKPSISNQRTPDSNDKIAKENFIREQVLNLLGRPKSLNFIRASNVFDNRWRVDVWCYFDSQETIMPSQCSKILHSYFIHASEDGTIIKSSPSREKEY